MFLNNLYPAWSEKNPVFHSACVNLSLFKDLNQSLFSLYA